MFVDTVDNLSPFFLIIIIIMDFQMLFRYGRDVFAIPEVLLEIFLCKSEFDCASSRLLFDQAVWIFVKNNIDFLIAKRAFDLG